MHPVSKICYRQACNNNESKYFRKLSNVIQCFSFYITRPDPVKLFRRRMHNYATLWDKFIQHYVIRGDISPYFRRLIVVNDRFCGDNLIGI